RYQPTFAQFQAAIQEALDGLSTTHAEKLKSLMTLKFQRFEDVSLMAAQGIALFLVRLLPEGHCLRFVHASAPAHRRRRRSGSRCRSPVCGIPPGSRSW